MSKDDLDQKVIIKIIIQRRKEKVLGQGAGNRTACCFLLHPDRPAV